MKFDHSVHGSLHGHKPWTMVSLISLTVLARAEGAFTQWLACCSLCSKEEVDTMEKKEKYETKRYLHFGRRISFDRNIENYVNNPSEIKEHSFFPLIYYPHKAEKFDVSKRLNNTGERPIKKSKRNIMYASHLDNFIYKHYGEELNKCYNLWVHDNNIDHCSIAYRSKEDEEGKSNIDFAAEIINYIYQTKECFIMIGDFEKFFETLDHALLKRRVATVLGVGGLSEDWYKVFKSVTKFCYYDKRLLNQVLGTDKELKKSKKLAYFSNAIEFRNFRKEYKPKINNEKSGIPQGTALSAVLSNVYTTAFDIEVNNIVEDYNGIYRRYSDDFIIVIPKEEKEGMDLKEFNEIESQITKITEKHKLTIQSKKTKLYQFKGKEIVNLTTDKKDKLDYLGFIFNGKSVEMRGKSPYKFYRNAYKLIRRAKKVKKRKGLKKIPYRKQIYGLYTDKGTSQKPYGNFITYAKRSQSTFDRVSPHTNNLMMQQIKNRKKKIEKKMGVKLNIRS